MRTLALLLAAAIALGACQQFGLKQLGFKPGSHPYSKDTVDHASGDTGSTD